MQGKLNLPKVNLKTILDGDIVKVYDPLRRKYVALTPEEFVRQHFASWMQTELGYPASMMANEVKVELNGTLKRCDTLVYGPDTRPLMIVEYKAPDIKVSQVVFDQIVRYNMQLRAKYLVVSNGINHYCCVIDYKTGSYNFIPKIPRYEDITSLRDEEQNKL